MRCCNPLQQPQRAAPAISRARRALPASELRCCVGCSTVAAGPGGGAHAARLRQLATSARQETGWRAAGLRLVPGASALHHIGCKVRFCRPGARAQVRVSAGAGRIPLHRGGPGRAGGRRGRAGGRRARRRRRPRGRCGAACAARHRAGARGRARPGLRGGAGGAGGRRAPDVHLPAQGHRRALGHRVCGALLLLHQGARARAPWATPELSNGGNPGCLLCLAAW